MKKFTLIQKIRNKIRVYGSLNLEVHKSAKIANCFIYSKGINNKLVIEEDSVLRYVQLEILGDNCSILIGRNCNVGHDSYLSAKDGKTLKIENNCSLSRNVKIMTSDGHPIYQNTQIINHAEDIRIENNVWVADNVTILKGAVIGANSVLGINSTVTKSVPANSIAAGNPAKVVKQNISWEH